MKVCEGIPDIKKVNPLDIATCISYAAGILTITDGSAM